LRVAVIGGTGFIGHHVTRWLVQAGADVTAIHRGQTPVRVPGVRSLRADRKHTSTLATALTTAAPAVVVDMTAYTGEDPRALKFIQDAQPLPASFATLAYFGNNAFVFVDGAGTRRAGRYQILPAAGIVHLDSLEASGAGPQYLFQDLPRRLARGPVRFRLVAQMANPGDQTSDGSIIWPDDRKVAELGTLALTAIAPDNEKLQRELTYNPIFLTPGIQLSDDPMISLRSAVYALSVAHRR